VQAARHDKPISKLGMQFIRLADSNAYP